MIAVTGANGLLGNFIIRQLVADKIPLVALKRKNADTSLLADLKDQITWRDADVTDPVALHEALQDVEGVIHTAAMVSFNPRKEKELYRVNVDGTKNIVDACLNNHVKRLVQVSSVAALGRQKGQTIIDERNTWIDNPLNTFYGETKYKAELEVYRGQEEGLSTVIVNPSVILARGNWDKSSARLFQYVWKEHPFFTEGSFNYVDVRDVASVIIRLYSHPVQGERFVASAGAISFIDFFSRMAKLLDKKPPRIKVGKSMLHLVAAWEAFRTRFTSSEPLITKETARLAETNFLFDNQKVTRLLDFQFQPIDNSLAWCAEYYRAMAGSNK